MMNLQPGKLIELIGGASDGQVVRVHDGSPFIVAVVKGRAHMYHLRESFPDRAFAACLCVEDKAEREAG